VSRDRQTLVVDDVDALIADSRYLDAVVPEAGARGQLKLDNLNTNSRLIGTTAAYVDLFNYRLSHGRFFTSAEDEQRKRVVVIGADIPGRLQTEPAALIGRTLAVNGQPFEVIGILASIGGGFGNQSPDFSALIPLRTAEQRVLGREEIDNISCLAHSQHRRCSKSRHCPDN
jgi:putative ABC transport system permease protein